MRALRAQRQKQDVKVVADAGGMLRKTEQTRETTKAEDTSPDCPARSPVQVAPRSAASMPFSLEAAAGAGSVVAEATSGRTAAPSTVKVEQEKKRNGLNASGVAKIPQVRETKYQK